VTVLKRVVIAAVPCLVVLTGCGVTGTEFHPGVAAQVGDDSVTTDQVDELVATYCDAVDTEIRAGGQKLPLSGFKAGITVQLAIKSASEQIADEYGVKPSADYKLQLSQIEDQAAAYKGAERDAFVTVQSTQPYYVDLLTQVGKLELEADGQQDPTIDLQQSRGQDELATWVGRHGLTFDPRYGLEMVDGAPKPVDTDISFAVGDLAKDGKSDGDPKASYVDSLPASATCG
jgi:peptidyl-prolyl cis-trans isomerase SurA